MASYYMEIGFFAKFQILMAEARFKRYLSFSYDTHQNKTNKKMIAMHPGRKTKQRSLVINDYDV